MATMDIFNSNAFSSIELTAALERVPYQPMMISSMGIFEDVRVRTTDVMIEERSGTLQLIQTTRRGEAPKERVTDLRLARSFRTPRIAKGDTLYAHEIQNIRAFGSDSEFMQVQAEVARRSSGPTGIQRDVELTWENMRLGAVQGLVVDADGSTLYNWFTEFSVTQDTEIDFDLDNAAPVAGVLRRKCAQVVRQMSRAGQGAFLANTRIQAIVGDNFWDDLIAHSEIRTTYLNTSQAAELRTSGVGWGESFVFGGIQWTNYRGTDDGSTIAVGTDKAKFFPVGAPGVFQVAWSPAETFEFANTPGRDMYLMTIPDRDRNSFVRIEMYSYPLFYCTRPKMLQQGRRT